MHLQKLYLHDFKNYAEAELEFCPRINCFVGNNGSGKTNLLDAIHYLSFSKSYFGSADKDNIRHGEEAFCIHGLYVHEEDNFNVSLVNRRGSRKSLKYNQKEYERFSDHVGKIPLIMVSPQDQELIYGGSELRRKFLDSVISQFNRQYLEKLILYNKTLDQRNKLLKQDAIDMGLLEIFDMQLCEHGSFIYQERKRFVSGLVPGFAHFYKEIAGSEENASLEYMSVLDNRSFEEVLKESAQKDRILQYTSAGIHKDDLTLLLDGYPIRRCGSQGQQKSYLLALRLSQLQFIAQIKKSYPILLLDDVFDKLDLIRVKRLMDLVGKNHFGQVFLSDTHHSRVKDLFEQNQVEHFIYRIEGAQAHRID